MTARAASQSWTLSASPEELMRLAGSRAVSDRDRLLLAVAELGAAAPLDPVARGLLGDILLRLMGEAERDIRQRLAERIADKSWAPPALVHILALDEIEIAAPVIAASPVLKDADLVRLLVEATLEHRIAVAGRPGIGAAVVDAILSEPEAEVVAALAGNSTAAVTDSHMTRMVRLARRMTAVRQPLARHPRLQEALARELYGFVGETLREGLVRRFRLDPAVLAPAVADTVGELLSDLPTDRPPPRPASDPAADRRLAEKLHAAGQLRPGALLRALREERLGLFAAGLAVLGGFSDEQVRRALHADTPEPLALACAAVGIDRSVFPSLLHLVRGLNAERPFGDGERARAAAEAFAAHPETYAAAAFRRATGA